MNENSDLSQQNDQQQKQLESSMKDLLEKMLTQMEKYIKTKEDLQEIENKLKDYDNLNSLFDIIKTIFTLLIEKVEGRMKKSSSSSSLNNQDNLEQYDMLEKTVQKHEAEIRTHIGLEQQLKLYAESLQAKLDESEKQRSELLESSKNMINGVKRDNQKLSENLKQSKEENDKLKEKLKKMEENEKMQEEKIQSAVYLQEKVITLEKMLSERSTTHSIASSLAKDNSYKKMNSNDPDFKKKNKAETPPISNPYGTSPLKPTGRAPTPTLLRSNNTNTNQNNNENQDFRNSYQRFYNQVKNAREESLRNISKERDPKTVGSNGQSIATSNNNSFVCTSSSSKGFIAHKRSKSHQINKMRGLIGSLKNPTENSRLSNQDYSDVHIAGSMLVQEKNKQTLQ